MKRLERKLIPVRIKIDIGEKRKLFLILRSILSADLYDMKGIVINAAGYAPVRS